MCKPFLLLSILLLLVWSPAHGQPDDLREVKARLRALEQRVGALEKAGQMAVRPAQRKTVPGAGGWKNKANWPLLELGMTKAQARNLLGEPGEITKRESFELWYYPDVLGGQVYFNSNGRIDGWGEP